MACYIFKRMFPGCGECARLWKVYSEAITSHIRAENKLKLALLAHRTQNVPELSARAEEADRLRMDARDAIREHEIRAHDQSARWQTIQKLAAARSERGGADRTREILARDADEALSKYLEASRSFLEVTQDVPSGAPNPDGALRVELPARNRRLAFEEYQKAIKKLAEHDQAANRPKS